MTEEEAKQRWCPYAIYVFGNGRVSGNRDDEGGRSYVLSQGVCNCIASDCMLWRWELTQHQANELNARGNNKAVAYGYCGLGGKP